MRTIDKEKLGYVWYVDNGSWLAGPYQKKPSNYGGGKPVRFKLTPDDQKNNNLVDNENETQKVVLEGYSRAMDGGKLLVDFGEKGMASFQIDKKTRWDLYCKDLKITIEQ